MLTPQKPQTAIPSTSGHREAFSPSSLTRHLDIPLGTEGILLIAIKNLAMITRAYGSKAAEEAMSQLETICLSQLPKGALVQRFLLDALAITLPGEDVNALARRADMMSSAVLNHLPAASGQTMHLLPHTAVLPLSADDPRDMFSCLHRAHAMLQIEGDAAQLAQESRQQMELADYLKQAIRDRKLRLAYQPVVHSFTGKICHYEALLRLVGHDGKVSSAGTLIPIAEKLGLIQAIDDLVLDMVIEELKKSGDVSLAMNVSSITTANSLWLDRLSRAVEDRPDMASRLIVEITETAALRDLRDTAYFVAAVQGLGCRVALDDFGAGYTSFRQLRTLSVDMVKIDGAFIRDIRDNPENLLFVKTLLDFIKGFGLEAVAEFVETGDVAKQLMEMG
ncbi:MAG: EAL domain-containing protein, partial [Alphaproteobacteria bacterium]|nr:EAL domain-containing protein [Alphaproteobacteria bacterium]